MDSVTEQQRHELDRIRRYANLADESSDADIPWSLHLGHPYLVDFPREFWRLNISHLELSGQLGDLPADLARLPLRALSISSDELRSLPAAIGGMHELTTLEIVSDSLDTLPAEIVRLARLNTLRLETSRLSSLPSHLDRLRSLRTLEIWISRLAAIPTPVTKMVELVTLRLLESGIRTLPDEIVRLASLENLELVGNELGSVPASLGSMCNLRRLSLDENKLVSLPDLSGLTSLRDLSLGNNALETTDFGLGGMRDLEVLTLARNPLCGLSADIAACGSLRNLRLEGCGFTSVPDTVAHLLSLEMLDLRNNALDDVPPWVADIPGLADPLPGKGLRLSGNPLSKVSELIRSIAIDL